MPSNHAGNVPTLVLDDGTILNEGAATLQYLADQVSIAVLLRRNLHTETPTLLETLRMLCALSSRGAASSGIRVCKLAKVYEHPRVLMRHFVLR